MKFIRAIFANCWKIYVGIVFTLMAVLTYPIMFVLLRTPAGKRSSFRIFVCWSWVMRICCLYIVRKNRTTRLPSEPVIIVSNHSSYLDIFLMYSIFPDHPFLFLGKSEILKYPLIRTYFKKLNIPVFRSDKVRAARSFMQAIQAVRQNWSLVIFPEGGIADEGLPDMQEFKDGAFRIAKKTNTAVLPVTFLDNYHLFSDPSHVFGGAHPGISRVIVHDLIGKEEVAALSEEALKTRCFDQIREPLLKHYPHLRKK